jgi:hypothetical protein
MKITIVTTFTDSPSLNVRILEGARTIFYNSERLQGNSRLEKVAEILGIKTLKARSYEMEITEEQLDAIWEVALARIPEGRVIFNSIVNKDTT